MFNHLYSLAIDSVIKSVQNERFSSQQIIPPIKSHLANVFQLEMPSTIEQESSFQIFNFQYGSQTKFQPVSTMNSKIRILQTEINFLKKQYDESIVTGDFTRQSAAEQAIATKLQNIELLQAHKNIVERSNEEQNQEGSFMLSTEQELYQDSHTAMLPVSPRLSESTTKTWVEPQENKIVSDFVGKLIPKMDSTENIQLSLVTTNAKELYEELEKMKYTFEIAFDNVQQPMKPPLVN